MLDAGTSRHAREQFRGAVVLDPALRPVDKGVMDVMIGNGGADRIQIGGYFGQRQLSG